MKSNKVYIILIVTLFLFAGILYLLIGLPSRNVEKREITILTGEKTAFQLKNGYWQAVNSSYEIGKYDWEKYSVYLDDEYSGEYYLWNDGDNFRLFDLQKQAVHYTEKMLALRANFNLNVKTFEIFENIDYNYVLEMLESHGISSNESLTVNNYLNVDIDSDGKEETIYVVSNAFIEEVEPETTFSFVFMIKDNKTYMLYEYQEKNLFGNALKPYIHSILDADGDGSYEILLTCSRYSIEKPIYTLYKFDNQKFKKLASDE